MTATPAALTWSGVAARRMARHALAEPAADKDPAAIAGILYPVLLVDGVVGGIWHQRRSGRKLAITIEPLREPTAQQRRELDDEAALVGAVMEAAPTLTIGPVTVGPHA